MAGQDTRERILDAAERLFANRGFAATSLRTIIAEAGVNLAAIHYHFGSKEALIRAVFARRFGPVTSERLRRLDALERAAGTRAVPVEALLDAFIRPAVALYRDSASDAASSVTLLIGRLHTEPGLAVRKLLYEEFRETVTRYVDAFARALPHLALEEVYTRFHFMIGTMASCFTDPQRLDFISSGRVPASDLDALIQRLVVFLAGALRAPKTEVVATTARQDGGTDRVGERATDAEPKGAAVASEREVKP